MNLYIDPKAHHIETSDPMLYKVWEERVALRMKHFTIGKEIEALDQFIELYVARMPPGKHLYSLSLSQQGVSTAENGTAPHAD